MPPAPQILLTVEPVVRELASPTLRRRLRRRAVRILRAVELPTAELSILLAGDETLAALNAEYRGKRGPTDVLSFSQYAELPPELAEAAGRADGPPTLLGDLAISLELVRRRSPKPAAYEGDLVTLLAHGILHLLGFDHATGAEERVMFGLQAELVRIAGGRGPVTTVAWR